VKTLGIDLAAQPERTAICSVAWDGGRAFATVEPRATDERLLELMAVPWDKIGIDCPLGWPEPFIEAITAHRDGRRWPGRNAEADEYRERAKYRLTDEVVHEREGRWPLSVSTDRIGVVALRCALLLDRHAGKGKPLRRDGSGVIAEVYPAAAIRRWLPEVHGSYKRTDRLDALRALVDAVTTEVPIHFADGARELCETSHDAFDALICALVARAVVLRQTRRPRSAKEARRAATEGWIHVPKKSCTLAGLSDDLAQELSPAPAEPVDSDEPVSVAS
jgi:predicted nuclease with RNAse H fold